MELSLHSATYYRQLKNLKLFFSDIYKQLICMILRII